MSRVFGFFRPISFKSSTPKIQRLSVLLLILSAFVFSAACGGATSPESDTTNVVDTSSSCSPGTSLTGDEACTACSAEECICLADNTWKSIGAACSTSCEPGTTATGEEACTGCSCDECICLADKTWKCLGEACATGTCEPGDTKEAGDGCNTCACDTTGEWQCTANTCGECIPGETKKTNDGCNDCFCTTDAAWDCGDDPCACTPGATQAAEDGCNTCECTDGGEWECTNDPCGECAPGDTKTAADGCSVCTCTSESTWSCDSSGCTGCPPPKAHECALKDSWAKNPNTDECCYYDSPCARPDESWPSFDVLAECEGEEPPPTECTPGDTQPAGDGCNTCTCTSAGQWECGTQQCGCTPGDITVNGCNYCVCNPDQTETCSNNDCNVCGVPWDAKVCAAGDTWGKEPSTETCCQYAKECWVPMGYDIFASVQDCENSNIPEPICTPGQTQPNGACPDKPQAACTCNSAGSAWDCPTCPLCSPGETSPNPQCPGETNFQGTCNAQGTAFDYPSCPVCDPLDGIQANPECADQFPGVSCSCSANGMSLTCAPCQVCTPNETSPIEGCTAEGISAQQLMGPQYNNGQGFKCQCAPDGLSETCDPCPECLSQGGGIQNPACDLQSFTCTCSQSYQLTCNEPCPECAWNSPIPEGAPAECECQNGQWKNCETEGCPSGFTTMTDSQCINSDYCPPGAGAQCGDNIWRKANNGECCEYPNTCSQPASDHPQLGETQFWSLSACEQGGNTGCEDITSFCNLDCCGPANNWGNCMMVDGCKTCNCEAGGGPSTCNASPDGALPTGTPGQVVNNGCVQCVCQDTGGGLDWQCNEDGCETCDPTPINDSGLGIWKMATDNCNGCHCSDAGGGVGYYTCSTYSCSPNVCAAPIAGPNDTTMWGLSPGGLCCPYPGPLKVPTEELTGGEQGYKIFAEEAECHAEQLLWGVPGAPSSKDQSHW